MREILFSMYQEDPNRRTVHWRKQGLAEEGEWSIRPSIGSLFLARNNGELSFVAKWFRWMTTREKWAPDGALCEWIVSRGGEVPRSGQCSVRIR